MIGVETVAEGVAHDVISHHASVPGVRQTQQPSVATRRLIDRRHAET
jgi:hypothetical protein